MRKKSRNWITRGSIPQIRQARDRLQSVVRSLARSPYIWREEQLYVANARLRFDRSIVQMGNGVWKKMESREASLPGRKVSQLELVCSSFVL